MALARFRARVTRNLERDAGARRLCLAAIATLLDRLHLRVGSAAYMARHQTYRATTLLHRHLRLGDGEMHPIGSHHVNASLAEATGVEGVSAKTFRTWAGTLAAFGAAASPPGTLGIRTLSEVAAAWLHNTPAISRSSYIHPAVLSLATMKPAGRIDCLRGIRLAGCGGCRPRSGCCWDFPWSRRFRPAPDATQPRIEKPRAMDEAGAEPLPILAVYRVSLSLELVAGLSAPAAFFARARERFTRETLLESPSKILAFHRF